MSHSFSELKAIFTINNKLVNTLGIKPYQAHIVSNSDLLEYVEDGFDVISEISDNRFLVRKVLPRAYSVN